MNRIDTEEARHERPIVSVVMNCHNGERFLSTAIRSVLDQSDTRWELVFVDNQSTDGSRQVFESFSDPRLRYFKTEKFEPLGAARNVGISLCRGSYIAFLDADDVWESSKLKEQCRVIETCDADCIYSDAIMFYPDGRECRHAKRQPNRVLHVSYADLARNYDVCFSTIMLRTAAVRRLTHCFDSGLSVAEDADLLLRLAHIGKVVYMGVPTTRYRVHAGSDTWRKSELFLSDLDRMRISFKSAGIDEASLDPLYDSAYWVLMMRHWMHGDFRQARLSLEMIHKKRLRHFAIRPLLALDYERVAPLFRVLGKRVL